MSFKPLSYEGLRIVLQYMDPNQRFQLSLRAPALRTIEKIVPLKIDRVAFGDLDNEKALIINETKYQLGIYQKYDNPLQTPKFVRINNARGYSHYERDQYGCVDWDAEKRLTHGDILLSPSGEVDPDEIDEDGLDEEITRMEKNLKTCNKTYLELAKYRRDSRNYRQSGASPPYKFYIQLLTISKRGTQTERVKYNKPLSDALRHLVTAFFHHRKAVVQVDRLELLSTDMTLRLPVGLKLEIQELTFFNHENTSSALEAITPLLHEKSFPLESLTVVNPGDSGISQILANARKLIVTKKCHEVGQYLDLGNLEIHIPNAEVFADEAFLVARERLIAVQPVGSVHSFGVVVLSEKTFDKFCETLKFEGLNVEVGQGSFQILLNDHSKLHVSFEFDGAFESFGEKWNLTFKVVPR